MLSHKHLYDSHFYSHNPVVQLSPPHDLGYFNLFNDDDKEVLVGGAKIGHVGYLQDPNIPYD